MLLALLLGGDSCMQGVSCGNKVPFSSLAGTAVLRGLRGNGPGGDLMLLAQCEQLPSEEFSSQWVFKQQSLFKQQNQSLQPLGIGG